MNSPNDLLTQIITITKDQYPYTLKRIGKLPETMDMIGTMPPETYKFLGVVGSRTYSSYGKEVCEKLITGLAGYPIVIVSGLAIGIDSIAHEAALAAGLKTIAFPGSGLAFQAIYPQRHLGLARKIVEAGGALISPFEKNVSGPFWVFPARNKLMAGISHATLVIEAQEDSGSLITATDTSKFNRDLLVVPGSIFSPTSRGSNELLRNGGIAITSPQEILEVLGLIEETDVTQNLFTTSLSADEKKIIENLAAPLSRDELIRVLELPAGYVNGVLVELELKGVIKERQGLLMIN